MVYFYVLCSKNIFMQLVGYQQPACLCVKMYLWLKLFRFHVNCFIF